MPSAAKRFKVESSKVVRNKDVRKLYDRKWRKARLTHLRSNPLCVECLKNGRSVAADVVDHIIAHRGDAVLFWDQSNWQSLCKHHHDVKTMKEWHGVL